jgi:VanZ family protein
MDERTKELKKLLNRWLPPLIWAAVIFLFSSFPTTRASEIHWKDFIVKKTAHIIEYAVLVMLSYRALKISGVEKKKSGYYSIFASMLYGLTDEFHQSFTPGRDPQLRDVFFDTIGAVLAIYYIWNLLPRHQKSNKLFSTIYEFVNGNKEKSQKV